MKARYIFLLLLVTVTTKVFCQMPPNEFFAGIKLVPTDKVEAKKQFILALNKDPQFYGTYHFLGTIYMAANNLDSAAWYFNKSVSLNTANVNHTKELTYLRLINNYAYQHDFKNGFDKGWAWVKEYPTNANLLAALKDLCLWAFYIKYDRLDAAYLAQEIKPEYLVNSVAQEYLIMRKLRVNDEVPVMKEQVMRSKNGANYDVITSTIPTTKQTVTLNFKLNWDMMKEFGGKMPNAKAVIDDSKSAIYEKIGAMLLADDKTDVVAAITKLTAN